MIKNYPYFLVLVTLISSCQFFETEKISTETFYEEEVRTIDWKEVDQYPTFTECELETEKLQQKSCFERTLSAKIYEYLYTKQMKALQDLNDTLFLDFAVNRNATLTVDTVKIDSVIKAEFPKLEGWIQQSIDAIKLEAPAYKRGIPVKTEFTLPIIVKTQEL
ncbi:MULTISPECIES: hypothetical protein [Altibacter]|uniref:hypothetical protein n=1 Tax=Altibacter TaxID=1535231 RepID=UPI0005570037|nr:MULTISPECIES: hypothetical protein [Altibacter]MCW9037063.1 hypothetical protein [Altibacter sp.]